MSGWLPRQAQLCRPDTFLWGEEELSVVTWLPSAVIGLYVGYLLFRAAAGRGRGALDSGSGDRDVVVSGVRAHREANAAFVDWHLIP